MLAAVSPRTTAASRSSASATSGCRSPSRSSRPASTSSASTPASPRRRSCRPAARRSTTSSDARLRAALERGLRGRPHGRGATSRPPTSIFVCVPTPINQAKDPDLGPVLSAASLVARAPPRRPARRPPVDDVPGHDDRAVPRRRWSGPASSPAATSTSRSPRSASTRATRPATAATSRASSAA